MKIRKLKITDEEGNNYNVEEEIVDDVVQTGPGEPVAEHEHTDNEEVKLTDDEIKALKDLAAVAPKLMGLIKDEDPSDEHSTEAHADEDTDKIVETEETEKIGDSIGSKIGARVKKKVNDNDSTLVSQAEIESAWSKRFSR